MRYNKKRNEVARVPLLMAAILFFPVHEHKEFCSLSLIGSTFDSIAGTCCMTVQTTFHGILAAFSPRDVSHEAQQVEHCATCCGDKISPNWCCTSKKVSVSMRGHVAGTHPWDMFPHYFHVCANVVILSLLHVPATRACYMTPCTTHVFCRCNMTPRVWPH